MADRLHVQSGQTYEIASDGTQTFAGTDVDGELAVHGTLELTDSEGFQADESPLDLPLQSINFTNMNMGLSIFLVGMLGLMYGAAGLFKNYVAATVISLAVLALILSGTMGIGLELFWMLIALAAITLTAGVIIRWTQ